MIIENLNPFGALVKADGDKQSITDLSTDKILELLEKNLLVVFRGYSLVNDDSYLKFARQFGPLLGWEFGEILELKVQDDPVNHIFSRGRVELHWDGAFIKETPHYNLFQCVKSSNDDTGGKTLFVNTHEVLRRVKRSEQEQWKLLTIEYTTEKKAHYGGTISQTLVEQNPYNGKNVIRYIEGFNEDNEEVNPVQISINNHVCEPADQFINGFTRALYSDHVMYQHRWQSGDFLIADNSSLLHGRSRFESSFPDRIIKRINIL